MSELESSSPAPWITSLQSLRPVSETGFDERVLFYQAGYQAALRQQAEQFNHPVRKRHNMNSSLRMFVAALVLVTAASTVGYLTGRGVPTEPQHEPIAAKPLEAEPASQQVVSQSPSQGLGQLPNETMVEATPTPKDTLPRNSWLTRWLPQSLDLVDERRPSQILMAVSTKLSEDDLLMKNGVDAFIDENLFPRSSNAWDPTEFVSAAKPSKTLTAADLRELSQDWENLK